MKAKVGIIGVTGYAGEELLRLLASHPGVTIESLMSKSYAGADIASLYGSYAAKSLPALEEVNVSKIAAQCDVVFTALPHGASIEIVPGLLENGVKVVDLSGDFRYDDKQTYEQWYGILHDQESILQEAVYGLPELYRSKIKESRIVANPGCYTTTSILALYPLLANGLIDPCGIIIDAKSGTSGAGRKAKVDFGFCEVNNNFKAYGVTTHRHTSEIEQELSKAAGTKLLLSFTPHLLPVNRGIFATCYAALADGATDEAIARAYSDAFGEEPFTHVLSCGSLPELKHVCGSNNCMIGFKTDRRLNRIIVVSCTDNLIKGAAGQAIQNMNLMFGFEETCGLPRISDYL